MEISIDSEAPVLTEKILELAIEQGNSPKFITVKGYYNTGKNSPMTLQGILNYMYSKGYEFVQFISNVRNIYAEMLFKSI